jgi:hypothetical protein
MPPDLLITLRGPWTHQAEKYAPYVTTVSTEQKSEASALTWAAVDDNPLAKVHISSTVSDQIR